MFGLFVNGVKNISESLIGAVEDDRTNLEEAKQRVDDIEQIQAHLTTEMDSIRTVLQ